MQLKITYHDGREEVFEDVKGFRMSDGWIEFDCFKNTNVATPLAIVRKREFFYLEGDGSYVA